MASQTSDFRIYFAVGGQTDLLLLHALEQTQDEPLEPGEFVRTLNGTKALFVAYRGLPIGYLMACPNERSWDIRRAVVLPPLQRHGAGRAMLEVLDQALQRDEDNPHRRTIRAVPNNEGTAAWLQACGFHKPEHGDAWVRTLADVTGTTSGSEEAA